MNAPPSFVEAVDIARKDLSIAREEGAFDSAVAWKNIVDFNATAFFLGIRKAEENLDLKPSVPVAAISLVIDRADNYALSFDVLTVVAAKYLEADIAMPKVIAQWAAAMMRGEKKRPKRNGKFANGTLERNTYIWPVTRKLVESGMMATRNDTSPPESACDAVAEALKLIGESPASYGSVKRIWNDFQNFRGS
jgi:hypothetical protein